MTRIRRSLGCFVLFFFASLGYSINDNSRIAFYYGNDAPLEELHAFNWVIVHPDQHLPVKKYNNRSSKLLAYVSLGELEPGASFEAQIPKAWFLGKNNTWKSQVMDLSNPAWRDFIVDTLVKSLFAEGYQGVFLDTLDSYQLLGLTPEKNQQQQAGIVDIIQRIKQNYPHAVVITNRGFEVLAQVGKTIDAVAAESLFQGWNNDKKQYTQVSNSDYSWLYTQLKTAHDTYQLPIIVIDYVPLEKRALARETAKKITALGFIPWVSDPYLDTLGIGAIEVIPRKVLLLYNDGKNLTNNLSMVSVFTYMAFPLEFMGFRPVLKMVDDSLPERNLSDRYAGIITWFDAPVIKHYEVLERFISQQITNQVPVVFMQNFGVPVKSPLLHQLNIKIPQPALTIKKVNVVKQDSSLGYEQAIYTIASFFNPIECKSCEVLLKLEGAGQYEDAIAITSWGGYVIAPYDISFMPSGESRWIINPFKFLKQALRLPVLPIADVTTENGRRIFLSHIDGDGFISRVPWSTDTYAGELIYKKILLQYNLPITVSFIQREFELLEPNPEVEQRLITVAKEIAGLPWVRIATHTYSHPLKWGPLVEGELNTPYLAYPDPSYKFSYKKEFVDSAEFINKMIAPPDKKVEIVFWPGDANVQEKGMETLAASGLLNINGKADPITYISHSVSALAPMGLDAKNNFQVFAPVANEFQFTDNWARPMYLFDKVIHTFELTEKPYRFKPISVYYHFYSATEQGAMRALYRIYNWILQQSITPLYVKDYILKVLDFNQLVIAKYADNSWLIANNNTLREVRLPSKLGYPDLKLSSNILGFNTANDDHYIHLGTLPESTLRLSAAAPAHMPYLENSNANVSNWATIDESTIQFTLSGNVPLNFKLANLQHCQVLLNNEIITTDNEGNFSIQGLDYGTFKIQCIR